MTRPVRTRAGLAAVGLALTAPGAAAAPTVGPVRFDPVVVLGWAAVLAVLGALLVGRYASRFVGTLESFAGGVVTEAAHDSDPSVGRRPGSTDGAPADASPSADQQRVLDLLEENGGRLPQSEIVHQTPWSKSKVSRLLARMDVQDRIVKIRAGRENIIALPGEEPAAAQSRRNRESDPN